MPDPDAFRAEIRAWLEENCPPEMREPVRDEDDICWGGRRFSFKNEAQKQWLHRCAAKGYTVPDWPVAYGGAGMDAAQAKIWREEMHRIKTGDSNARSPKQAVAIGLSEARRAGVEVPPPKPGKASKKTRNQAIRDLKKGHGGDHH